MSQGPFQPAGWAAHRSRPPVSVQTANGPKEDRGETHDQSGATLAAAVNTVAALAADLLAAVPAAAATTTYTITGLGTLGGFKSTPAAINNNGQIVGSEDNEMVVGDDLLDGRKQLGMNLDLSVAASPAGTPNFVPGDVPQYVAAHHQTLPQLLGGRPINC